MNKYLVVWADIYGVSPSVVETGKDPNGIPDFEWVKMAAEAEEIEIKDSRSPYLVLVIDYPEKFYV